MTDRDGGWTARTVAADLQAAIRRGDYGPGTRIPSRKRLHETYGIADSTAHRVYRELRDAGLVYAVTGGGWYVRPQRGIVRSTRNRLSRAERDAGRGAFSTDCHAAGLEPTTTTDVSTVAAPEDVAAELDIAAGDSVILRDRVMRGDGEVLQLAKSYLPADLADTAPAIAEENTGAGGIYKRLEDAGHALTEYVETVAIGRADEHEARQMDLTPGDPVYRVTRVAWTTGRAVETNHITITGDRYELTYELPAT